METRPTQESPRQRPPVGWRLGVAISGGVLAGALFVGAHADSLGLPLIDFTPFSRAEKPVEVKVPHWVVRARDTSSGSASGAHDASVASARQVSAAGGETGRIDWLEEPEDKSDVVGETLNMLELPSLDMATGAAGPQAQPQLTSWPFRGMMGGSGFAGAREGPAMGGSRRSQAAQTEAVEPTAADNGLQQPVLDAQLLDGPVPEPKTWMTIILGLGLAGAALRNFRRRVA